MIKWSILLVCTLGLLAGSWYLYSVQPTQESTEVVLPPDDQLPVDLPIDPESVVSREVTLFIGDVATGSLVRQIADIDVRLAGLDAMAETIRRLLAPEDSAERNAAIPEGTELLSVFMTNSGVVYLNLNRNLQDRHIGGIAAELATVSSLVNTLLFNFTEIRQVQILVEGTEIETLAGHIDCRKPFSKMLLSQYS